MDYKTSEAQNGKLGTDFSTSAQKINYRKLEKYFTLNFEHGGNIYRLAEDINLLENRILDFSASINPLGPPISVIREIRKNLGLITNYPDPEASALKQAIAQFNSIDPESIICGNGSTELIYLIVRALKPKNVLIPIPTFSEYERACKLYGAQVVYFTLREEEEFDINIDELICAIVDKKSTFYKKPYHKYRGSFNNIENEAIQSDSKTHIDMVFLCNPNNPTGRLLKKEDILKLARVARLKKFYLVVDEAFIDFIPQESVLHVVDKNPYPIVIRSMTKFYALAGLRLGYGIFPKNIINIIKLFKEPWTVNTFAQKAGIAALRDSDYQKKTLRAVFQEKAFLEASFKKLGIAYVPSRTNYYLLRFNNAHQLIGQLRKKGILVRDCSSFQGINNGGYIRIAVKSRKHNKTLLQELLNTKQTVKGGEV